MGSPFRTVDGTWWAASAAVPNVHDVAILDQVVLTLQPQGALGTGLGLRARLQEGIPADYLGPDEVFFEIGVDGAGGFHRPLPVWHGPGAAFVLSEREKREQAQEFITHADEPQRSALPQIIAGEKIGGCV